MPAWKSRTGALSWRETPNNAPHRSRHAEGDDNMKEHLNRTAWGSCNSNCYILSEQQRCSGWPHYVSLSFSTIKENTFKAEECKRLAAALQGLPWKTAWTGQRGVQQRHLHVISNRDLLGHNLHCNWRLEQSHFRLQRVPSTPLQQHLWMHLKYLFWIAPDLLFQDSCRYTAGYSQGDCFNCSLQ